jgi:hypothetical protein
MVITILLCFTTFVVSTNWIIKKDEFENMVKEKFAKLLNINRENIIFTQDSCVTAYTRDDEYYNYYEYNYEHIKSFNDFYKYVKNLFYDENENEVYFQGISNNIKFTKLTIYDLNKIDENKKLLTGCIINEKTPPTISDDVRILTLICPKKVIINLLNLHIQKIK